MNKKCVDSGLTILEVMIAITIFGFLMIYISNIMGQQIRLHNLFIKRDDASQMARNAMMHVLDELRFTPLTKYESGDAGMDSGVYYYPKDASSPTGFSSEVSCLIDANIDSRYLAITAGVPTIDVDSSHKLYTTRVFYYKNDRSLWYRDQNTHASYLLADHISEFEINQVDNNLVQILLTVSVSDDPSEDYKLLSYIRIY